MAVHLPTNLPALPKNIEIAIGGTTVVAQKADLKPSEPVVTDKVDKHGNPVKSESKGPPLIPQQKHFESAQLDAAMKDVKKRTPGCEARLLDFVAQNGAHAPEVINALRQAHISLPKMFESANEMQRNTIVACRHAQQHRA